MMTGYNPALTEHDLHLASMDNKPYAAFHNKQFHGPEWLNINAMQMSEIGARNTTFRSQMFYNVYDLESLFYGKPKYEWITPTEMQHIFGLHSRLVSYMLSESDREKKPVDKLKPGKLKDTVLRYNFKQVGKSCVEWTFKNMDDIKILYGNSQVMEVMGLRSADLGFYMRENRRCKGYTVSKRYVKIDLDYNVVEVMG